MAMASARAENASGRPVLSFRNTEDLASADVNPDVTRIWLSGLMHPGTGAGWYERTAQAHAFLPILRAADGSIWQLSPSHHLDVRQFGAAGDGVADDTAAIQAALDCAVYGDDVPRTVYFPGGIYRTTDTLQVGYGYSYITALLQGEAFPHPNGREVVNSLIQPDFWDRPCINLQGGRRAHFRSLTLRGRNYDHLYAVYETMPDRTDRRSWLRPDLPMEADSRTAPYAGICIDAYSGERPEIAYPAPRIPDFVPVHEQYGRNFSSYTFVEDCQIGGFCVGLMVQPGKVPVASNGDFLNLRDCDISFNLTGIALGNADARCNNIVNCRLHFNYTSLDSVNYGNGRGSFMGHVAGSSFDNNVRIMDIDIAGHLPQGGGSPTLIDCYGESVYSLGRFIGAENSAPKVVTFQQCKFQFSVKHREFSPTSLLEGRTGIAVIQNCTFMGGFGFFSFDCAVDMRNFAMVQPVAGGALGLDTEAGRAAAAYTCGIHAREAGCVSLFPSAMIDFDGVHGGGMGRLLASDRFPVALQTSQGLRSTVIPWWAASLHDGVDSASVQSPMKTRIDRAVTPVASKTVQGNLLTVEFDNPAPDAGESAAFDTIGAGDLVRDEQTGHVYFIASASKPVSGRLALLLQSLTGLRTFDYGQTYETSARLATDRGVLTVETARRFYPAARLANAVGRLGETHFFLQDRLFGSQAIPPTFVREGDRLYGPRSTDAVPATPVGRVARRDDPAGPIEFMSPLPVSVNGPCPLFVRQLGDR
jgi:hypothetical protein